MAGADGHRPVPASPPATLAAQAMEGGAPGGTVEVTVWTVRLSLPRPLRLRASALLSPEEHAHAARLRFEGDRTTFIARRAARRLILAPLAGTPPGALVFGENAAHGRPSLPCRDAPRFSVSRSGDLALVAVADVDVGVDVERVGTLDATAQTAAAMLGRVELRAWQALPVGARPMALIAAWTRKEAVAKALGHGLSVDPRRLDVWRPAPAPQAVASADGQVLGVDDGVLTMGHPYAVATAGGWPSVSFRAFCWRSALGFGARTGAWARSGAEDVGR